VELNKFNLQFFAENPTKDSTKETENIDIPSETPEEKAVSATLEQMEQDLETAEAKATELEEKLGALTEAVKGMFSILGLTTEATTDGEDSDKVRELEQTIEGLKTSLNAITEERDSLLDQVSEFKAQTLKAMAEKIADLKVALGDIAEEDKQAEIDRLAEKSEETLLFAVEELERRAGSADTPPVPTKVPKVSNPAMVENDEPQVIEVDDEEGKVKENTTVDKKISPVDIYKELLTGKRFK
jgi:uncharacterized protein YoxC